MNKNMLILILILALAALLLWTAKPNPVKESPEIIEIMVKLEKARLQTAILKEVQAQSLVGFYVNTKKYALISVLSVLLTSACIIALATGKRLTTLYVQLAQDVRIPVRHKDLKNSMPLATQYLSTKEAAALTDNRQEAFKMFVQLAQTAAALNKTLPSPTASAPALPASSEQSAMGPSSAIPAFRDILNTLEPGDPMVLGFDHITGTPITGGFKRIYSCGIFGVSGSGKTTGLYSIIAQSLLLYPEIKYMVIDPHADRPEGLTKGLPKTKHFEHLDALNVRPGLTRFVQELDNRLKTNKNYKNAPFVLLIDELPVIMKSSQGQAVEAVLGRIASEGRKVDMFALISGQDTRLKAAGGNRDLLTSQIAYNLKKKQARYLFDDAEIVDLHKVVRDAKEPGLCVFNATDDMPVLMKQPLCTHEDVMYVTQLISNGEPISKYSTYSASVDLRDTNETPLLNDTETGETAGETSETSLQHDVKVYLERTGKSQNEIADILRISRKDMSYFMNDKSMSDEKRNTIETLLRSAISEEKREPGNSETSGNIVETEHETEEKQSNVIPFAKKGGGTS